MSNNIISNNENQDFSVSYADKISNTKVQQVPFAEIVQIIKTGKEGLNNHITALRAITDETERRNYKVNNLPYFSMAVFTDDYRDDSHFKQTQYLLYDLDHIGTSKDVHKAKSTLTQDPHIYFCAVSPSGDGLKFCYRLDKPVTEGAEYRRLYFYYSDKFGEQSEYSQFFDLRDDPSRTCFLTYDPEVYVNVQAESVGLSIPDTYTIPEKYKLRALGIANPSKEPLDDLLSKGFKPGHRTPAMESIIGYLIHKGIGRNTAITVLKQWNPKNDPPLKDKHIETTVISMYNKYEHAVSRLPFDIVSKENCYYKRTEKDGQMKDVLLTTFTIKPEELLILEDGDCLQVTVETNLGYTYKPVYLENSDWVSKIRFLEAIGHQDCVMMGTDNDLLGLCAKVNAQVPVRKRGTRIVGLYDESVWVAEGVNITASGVLDPQEITPYQKGGDAFYHNIRYKNVSDNEYNAFISGLYSNILAINTQETLVPWLSWILTTPIKQVIMRIAEGYPFAFVHGGQGSGKTSTAKMFMRLAGYRHYEPSSCDMRRFPLLDLLCSTNGIPVILDEFKVSDMKQDFVDNLYRFMRKIYAGETEPKGQSDLSVEQYRLTAPLCVMGEWNVGIPAISERMIMVKYTDAVKHDLGMQKAFEYIWAMPLEAFMPRYIEYLLKQDIGQLYRLAQRLVKMHFKKVVLAPRVKNNLTVMVLGIKLFKDYGRYCKVQVPKIAIAQVLDHELSVITGTRNGFVRTAVDQFIEACSVMTQNHILRDEEDFIVTYIDLMGIGRTHILALRFDKIYDKFKEHVRRTGYEGDRLDKRSYMDQLGQCPYVHDKSYVVKIPNRERQRCVVIDINKAKTAGIDLEGFGIL